MLVHAKVFSEGLYRPRELGQTKQRKGKGGPQMKTQSKENEFGKTSECSKGKLRRLLTGVMLAAGAILFLCLVIGPAVAGRTDSCQLTSQAALRSCQARAPSDYFLAIGKCDNVADPVA